MRIDKSNTMYPSSDSSTLNNINIYQCSRFSMSMYDMLPDVRLIKVISVGAYPRLYKQCN